MDPNDPLGRFPLPHHALPIVHQEFAHVIGSIGDLGSLPNEHYEYQLDTLWLGAGPNPNFPVSTPNLRTGFFERASPAPTQNINGRHLIPNQNEPRGFLGHFLVGFVRLNGFYPHLLLVHKVNWWMGHLKLNYHVIQSP